VRLSRARLRDDWQEALLRVMEGLAEPAAAEPVD